MKLKGKHPRDEHGNNRLEKVSHRRKNTGRNLGRGHKQMERLGCKMTHKSGNVKGRGSIK
jgi:hypothetical protein